THDGTQSRREVEPYRLVRSGVRWYLVAWDLSREDWRSFRVDRMEPKIPTGPRFTPRELPAGGAADFVSRGVARAYSSTRATVLLHAPIEQIAPMVSEQWGSVESTDEGRCVIVLSGTSLRSIAMWLRAFDVDFTVVNPPELREECRAIAAETAVAAQRYLDA
ncbi:WYL domain-containing protein, partial [Rhodococcus erythropolis]|nr:WYL domain-containing protein [Rhodococcus erythropolis]